MEQCHYCLEYKLEERAQFTRAEPKKKLRFPDGQKIEWARVCWDCVRARNSWEKQRELEKFQLAEQRRQWHLDVAERNAAKRAEFKARNAEREAMREDREARQREADMTKIANIEAQMAMLQNSLDKLRKKYFSQT